MSSNPEWSRQLKELFCQALELKKRMTRDDYLNPPKQVTDINNRLDEQLTVDSSIWL